MVNLIMKEIMAVMNIRQVIGASLTPRHQGKVERSHQILMRKHLILNSQNHKGFFAGVARANSGAGIFVCHDPARSIWSLCQGNVVWLRHGGVARAFAEAFLGSRRYDRDRDRYSIVQAVQGIVFDFQ